VTISGKHLDGTRDGTIEKKKKVRKRRCQAGSRLHANDAAKCGRGVLVLLCRAQRRIFLV